MKKKYLVNLIALSLLCPIFVGCSSQETGGNSKNVSIENFTTTSDGFETKIDNDIEVFSFINKVSVPNNYTWNLYSDFEATNEIVNKTIRCEIGNNRVYMLVHNTKDTIGFYTVDVYRYHMYSVNFNTQGGTFVPSQNVQEESFVAPVDNPTKKGYTFVSWDYDFATPVTRNLTITASWSANSYNISLDVNGGNPIAKTTYQLAFDQSYSFEEPTLKGKDFVGWYLDSQLIPSSGKWSIDKDCELKAHWQTSQYTISYDPNGGSLKDDSLQTVLYGDSFALRQPSRKGYSFSGWYSDDTKIENGIWNYETNLNLVAHWEANTYTITFDYRGGTGSELSRSIIFDSDIVLPSTSKDGYTFKGWYYGEQLVENGKWAIDDNVTLFAHWEANTYKVTLSEFSTVFQNNKDDVYTVRYHEKNGSITTKTYKYGEQIDIYTPSSSSGYYFDGWFTDSELTNPFVINDGFTTKETDLYAKYSSDAATIIVNKEAENYKFPSNTYTSTYYFNVPMSGDYTFNITFNLKKLSSTSGNFYCYLWIQNRDSARVYVTKSPSSFSETISYSETISLTAGERILIKEAHNDSYLSAKSTWDISVNSHARLDCIYNQEDYKIDATYDCAYNLGKPTSIPEGKTFVGWFTEENGQGTKVTDSNGDSIANWYFLSNKLFYPFFN